MAMLLITRTAFTTRGRDITREKIALKYYEIDDGRRLLFLVGPVSIFARICYSRQSGAAVNIEPG